MDVFVGFISPFPWTWPPRGWSTCQGQVLAISQNTALFSLLGTTFGGNGQSTFGLPDLRGRMPIGFGPGPGLPDYRIGEMSGTASVVLNPNQVPVAPHTHPATFTPTGSGSAQVLVSTNPTATKKAPENGDYLAAQKAIGGMDAFAPGTPAPTTTVNLGGVSGGGGGTVTVDPNTPGGGGQSVSLMNPYLALSFCIALQGIFPSRN